LKGILKLGHRPNFKNPRGPCLNVTARAGYGGASLLAEGRRFAESGG